MNTFSKWEVKTLQDLLGKPLLPCPSLEGTPVTMSVFPTRLSWHVRVGLGRRCTGWFPVSVFKEVAFEYSRLVRKLTVFIQQRVWEIYLGSWILPNCFRIFHRLRLSVAAGHGGRPQTLCSRRCLGEHPLGAFVHVFLYRARSKTWKCWHIEGACCKFCLV